MREHLPAQEKHEALPSPEQHELLAAKASAAEKAANAEAKTLSPQEARTAIVEAQLDAEPLSPQEKLRQANETPQPTTHMHVDGDLENITHNRLIRQIQRKHNLPVRAFSKVVHQPVVRAVSEGASKTVSRPSGLLGGGLVALLGTSAYLYLSRHIGFEYNYGVFLVLFAGGFAFGLFLEFLVHLATASRRKNG